MGDRRSGLLFALRLGLELLAVAAAFWLAFYIRYPDLKIENPTYYDYYLQLAVFLHLLWLVMGLLSPGLRNHLLHKGSRHVVGIARRWTLHLALLALFIFSLQGYYYSRLFFVYFYVFLLGFLLLSYVIFRWVQHRIEQHLPGWKSRVLLLGDGSALAKMHQYITHSENSFRLLGYFSNTPERGINCNGTLADAEVYLNSYDVDEVMLATTDEQVVRHWFALAERKTAVFTLLPDVQPRMFREPNFQFFRGVLMARMRKEPLRMWHNRLLKRSFDLVVSMLIVLLTFWWILPLVFVGIRRSGKGPVFFRQSRPGRGEKPFDIYKFRTMYVNEEAETREAVPGDERITTFGRWLRKYHMDEWPQLFNVIRGEMSLVGPRPHLWLQNDKYREVIADFMLRQTLRPGITGLAQVSGLHGDISSDETIRDRVLMDIRYVENWSLGLDVEILFRTLLIVRKPS